MSANATDNTGFKQEVAHGQRFEFGNNWKKFLEILSDQRIEEAELSLKKMLRVESLAGRTFIDVGSGSGLFSLAARRLGATVRSFDYDPSSVWCTTELRRRYFPDDPNWIVGQGSVLDEAFVASLGTYDIVYSWGVLHHTGNLWKALELVHTLVKPDGTLYIALYNRVERLSAYWLGVKRAYCKMPRGLKGLVLYPAFVQMWLPRTILEFVKGKPFYSWRNYHKKRGMTAWRDVVDWVGGYPYEPSEPKDIFNFYYDRGYELRNLITTTGLGINHFVFQHRR
jgi:SAM-dependent methyltransferase